MILISVFFGCDSAEDLGTEFNLDTNVNVNVIDFSLSATNILVDSLRTDGENEILAGRFTDPLTGTVEAEGYIQYTFSGGPEETLPDDTLTFDSLVLEMEVLELVGDLGSPIDLEVYELSDTLEPVIYLATSSEVLGSSPVATFSGLAQNMFDLDGNPLINGDGNTRRSISIGFPNPYAQELYDQMKEVIDANNPPLTTALFKDLAIVPSLSASNLSNLSTNGEFSKLTFFMDDPDDDSVYTADFPLSGTEYSNVSRDRSTSAFSGVVEKQDFDLADGRTVLDPLAGVTTVFSLESVTDFFGEAGQILINSAAFEFGFQDNLPRDTVDVFNLYFRTSSGGFFAPASQISTFALGNIVLTDEGYIAPNPFAFIEARPSGSSYSINPTQFIQLLYNNYQELGRVAFINQLAGDTVDIEELVVVS
ncbi:MAG: DUF4270 family protein, partial [Bacteroidota bacterium]